MKIASSRSSWRIAFMSAMLLLITGLVAPAVSQASTISWDLTSDHCTGGCLADGQKAGTITVIDSGDGVNLSITLESGFKLINGGIGGDAVFVFNLNGISSVTYSNFTGGLSALPGGDSDALPLIHFDGTGDFEYGIACATCGNGGSTGLAGPFSVHIGGATAAAFNQNALGEYFAIDLINNNPGNGNTGAIDASAPVPEPSTLMLYALGVVMLVGGQKWRKARMSAGTI